MDGVDDLAVVDALEVDRGDAEIGVSKLALDDGERDAFARHLYGVGMTKLVWREAPPDAGDHGEVAQRRTGGRWRPWPSGGRAVDDTQEGADGHDAR